MTSLRLSALTLADCQLVRDWRELVPETLRTPYHLTAHQQREFYEQVVSNRHASSRYWAVRNDDGEMVAWAGLENIAWESGHAEISLLVDPARRRLGIGEQSVDLVLRMAFEQMRLLTVWGEVYHSNAPGVAFWRKVVTAHGGSWVIVRRRKWWGGKLHDSDLFTIEAPA